MKARLERSEWTVAARSRAGAGAGRGGKEVEAEAEAERVGEAAWLASAEAASGGGARSKQGARVEGRASM